MMRSGRGTAADGGSAERLHLHAALASLFRILIEKAAYTAMRYIVHEKVAVDSMAADGMAVDGNTTSTDIAVTDYGAVFSWALKREALSPYGQKLFYFFMEMRYLYADPTRFTAFVDGLSGSDRKKYDCVLEIYGRMTEVCRERLAMTAAEREDSAVVDGLSMEKIEAVHRGGFKYLIDQTRRDKLIHALLRHHRGDRVLPDAEADALKQKVEAQCGDVDAILSNENNENAVGDEGEDEVGDEGEDEVGDEGEDEVGDEGGDEDDGGDEDGGDYMDEEEEEGEVMEDDDEEEEEGEVMEDDDEEEEEEQEEEEDEEQEEEEWEGEDEDEDEEEDYMDVFDEDDDDTDGTALPLDDERAHIERAANAYENQGAEAAVYPCACPSCVEMRNIGVQWAMWTPESEMENKVKRAVEEFPPQIPRAVFRSIFYGREGLVDDDGNVIVNEGDDDDV